jgi:hypothetical protein
MLIDLSRTFHVQGFMGTFVVEDLDKIVEAGLLLKEVCGSGLGGFFLQSEMHAQDRVVGAAIEKIKDRRLVCFRVGPGLVGGPARIRT